MAAGPVSASLPAGRGLSWRIGARAFNLAPHEPAKEKDSTMAKKAWAPFPHPDKAFDYDGARLAKAWPALHAGDQEPIPDDKRVAALLKKNPKLGKDASAIAASLQDAWRAFHRGDFQQA